MAHGSSDRMPEPLRHDPARRSDPQRPSGAAADRLERRLRSLEESALFQERAAEDLRASAEEALRRLSALERRLAAMEQRLGALVEPTPTLPHPPTTPQDHPQEHPHAGPGIGDPADGPGAFGHPHAGPRDGLHRGLPDRPPHSAG
ncbi:MAG: hypothetical protein KatS3mg103_0782 [Phycisphaerales bacterium]|nr:MAG: hypothetical protein KatS3mg103_0782 [Phycisphaerales bacterium]